MEGPVKVEQLMLSLDGNPVEEEAVPTPAIAGLVEMAKLSLQPSSKGVQHHLKQERRPSGRRFCLSRW